MPRERPRLLVVTHVPWEGPHRILAAFAEWEVVARRPLAGDPLPATGDVDAAVFMGGPMSVREIEPGSGLDAERLWLAAAHAAGLPILGVCLGAQLLARALGAGVRAGAAPEIGFAPIAVTEAQDPVVGPLAPTTTVLHWHGDVFDPPPGAVVLASSAPTPVQAFRSGRSWGVLCHAEADAALVEHWLAEPAMHAEAEAALGGRADDRLRGDAARYEAELIRRSTASFAAFADAASPGSAYDRSPQQDEEQQTHL